MAKVNPKEISYLFPGGEIPEPRFNRDEADYVVRSEGEFASAVEAHSEGDQIHIDPNARFELENREYEIRGDLISDGATLVQNTEDAWGWGTWQINFVSNSSQVCVGINLRGPHADGTIVDDAYTNGTGDYREKHILVGLMSESPRTTVYECDVSGFTYGNIMFRGKKCRAINNRSYNAAFDHLGYGIACMTDDGTWADRTVVMGNYTNNCRHHVEHGGRDNCTEIAYHTCGPKAPFSHVLDVHRPGSKKTVWHHITVKGNENNAEGGVNEVFNFRGTPIDYHEVYAVHFDYEGDVPPEPPETSNDGNGSAITQTNQGLEDRYTWAENSGGELDLDEYKPKDKPYSTEDTDGIKGFDRVHWLNRDNAFGPGAPAHVGSGGDEAPSPLWHRVKIGGDGNEGHYRIEADDVRRGDMANEGDEAVQKAATGYVKNGEDTYYIRGQIKASATDALDIQVMESGYTTDLLPDTSGALPVESPGDSTDEPAGDGDTERTGTNPLGIMNEQYDALADLSNQNTLDVSNGDDITGLLQEASNATDTITVVPAGEYRTDYLDLEMNDCAIIGEPGETVVLEPNSSRDEAGEYFITIEGDTWAFSNFVFDFSQDGYGGRLQADGETFVVSHIRNRGKYPPESKGFSTDVNAGETGLISQCKVSGTEQDGTDTNGILVSSSHEGTVYLRDCEMGRFTNNAVYGSDPGRDYGNDGRVVVEGGKFTNSNVANLRIGSTDSVAREATVVVDERVKTSEGNQSGENSRGIRVRDRHGCLVEDCDVTYREGGSPGNAAIAVHDEAGRAIVRNCRVKTAGQLPHLRVEESGMSGDVGVLVEGCHFSGDVDGDDAFDLGRDDLTIRNCIADFETDIDGIEYAPDKVQEPSTEPRDPVSTPVEEPETPERPEPEQPDDPTVPVEPPEVPDDPEGPAENETRIYVEGDGSTTEQLSYTIEVTGNARLGGLSGNSDNIVFNDGNATIKGQVPGDSDDDFFVTGEIVNIESDPALTIEVNGEEYVETSRVYLFGNQWVNEDERGSPPGWEAYKVITDAPAQEDRKADENDEIINPDSQAAIHGVLALNGGDAFIIEGSVTNIIAPPEINVWIDGNDYTGSRELRRPDGIKVPGESPDGPENPSPPDEAPDEPATPEKPDEGDGESPDSGDGDGSKQPEVPEPPKDSPDLPDIPDEIPQGDPSELTRAELVAGFVSMLNTLDYFNQE